MVRPSSASLAIAGLLVFSACEQAPGTNAAADLAAVEALRRSFAAAMNGADAVAVGDLYTADGVSQHNHDETVTGRDAIVESQNALFARFEVHIELTPDATMTSGTLGFDRGRYTRSMTPRAGGRVMTDEGRYVVLLQKEADGKWKVSSHIDNSAAPLPPLPVARTPVRRRR